MRANSQCAACVKQNGKTLLGGRVADMCVFGDKGYYASQQQQACTCLAQVSTLYTGVRAEAHVQKSRRIQDIGIENGKERGEV